MWPSDLTCTKNESDVVERIQKIFHIKLQLLTDLNSNRKKVGVVGFLLSQLLPEPVPVHSLGVGDHCSEKRVLVSVEITLKQILETWTEDYLQFACMHKKHPSVLMLPSAWWGSPSKTTHWMKEDSLRGRQLSKTNMSSAVAQFLITVFTQTGWKVKVPKHEAHFRTIMPLCILHYCTARTEIAELMLSFLSWQASNGKFHFSYSKNSTCSECIIQSPQKWAGGLTKLTDTLSLGGARPLAALGFGSE